MSERMPRTLFVYKRAGLDTAEIRGRQIAKELGCDSVSLPELSIAVAAKYDVVIYVKRIPDADILGAVRHAGVKQVMDILDNYSERTTRRAAGFVNAFIAANLTQSIYLNLTFGNVAVEIPHHHCNFQNLRIPQRAGEPTLGFISTPDHWPQNSRLAKKTGYRFVSNISRKGEGGFDQLISTYLATDIGFTYRMDRDKLRFNCANKLTNFMSFGIPSVLTPESGYLEHGKHGETVLYAYTPDDFVRMIKWLGENQPLRQAMGDVCYEAARPYHISRIAERYRKFLSSL